MDQIEKIYAELVSYDPSLSKDKEAVFRTIKNMIAAKPEVIVNAKRKEQFAHQLSEHIASSPSMVHVKSFSFRSMNKWATSFASLFALVLIVGATYIYQKNSVPSHIELKKNTDAHVAVEQPLHNEESVVVNSENNHEFTDRDMVVEEKNNTLLSHTRSLVQGETSVAVDTELTNIDNSSVRVAMDTNLGTGGGMVGAEPASQSMMMSKEAPVANSYYQQRTVAFVIIDPSGSGVSQEVLDVINGYDLPVTYVSSEKSMHAMSLSGIAFQIDDRNIATVQLSLEQQSMILFDVEYISRNVVGFKSMVQNLKNSGYVFVHLSAMQQ